MTLRYVAAVAALGAVLAAADVGSVAALLETVRTAVHAQRSDADMARDIDGALLVEQLDDAVIEQLQTEGAGPLALESLERKRDLSYALAAPARPVKLFDAPAAPTDAEGATVLGKAREFATHYTANLPNFLCTEDVRRYGSTKKAPAWKAEPSLQWEAGFADKEEHLKLIAIDGRPTNRKGAGGTTSTGEFGGVLDVVFQPKSLTKFAWERWANLNGRTVHVFAFSIDREHADFVMNASGRVINHRMTAAMRGRVYVDRESFQVRRITYDADGVPKGFPILGMHTVVDYDYAEIGGQKFLLPHRSSLRMVTKDSIARNITNFSNYRKFTSEANITFEK